MHCRNCYISRNYRTTASAGGKAKTDMECLMQRWGFVNIGLSQTHVGNSLLSFLLTLAGVIKAVSCMRRGDRLHLQYPVKKYFTFLCRMARMRGVRVVVLVHDLGSMRRCKLSPDQEIRRLSHADYIVALTPSMRQWLADHGSKVPSTVLGVWDFLSPAQPAAGPLPLAKPYKVVYAGALSRRKNSFLYKWGAVAGNYTIELYGDGFDAAEAENPEAFDVHAALPPEQLIENVRAHFALVWDGDSVDGCTGPFGSYLRYNAPHKTSLYLRCHLPLIVWDEAAMAPFVQSRGLGVCISSLADIERVFTSLTAGEYEAMCDNVRAMSDLVSKGEFLHEAFGQAAAALEK